MGERNKELAEALEWAKERPLLLVCLLRSTSNMPCRVRTLRRVAELCLDLNLEPEQCFVGQVSELIACVDADGDETVVVECGT